MNMPYLQDVKPMPATLAGMGNQKHCDFLSLLDRYLVNCRADGQSELSINAYKCQIKRFLSFCVAAGADPCATSSVYAYKAHVAESGRALSSIATYLSYLRSFFAFAVSSGAVADNPVTDAVYPPAKALRAAKKPYNHLMPQPSARTLVACEKPKYAKNKMVLRNRAIVLMLLGCGLRNSELRYLTPKSLRFGADGGCTVENGKGGKYRKTSFPVWAQKAVQEYMEKDRPQGLGDDELLFGVGDCAENWHVIERANLSTMVERYVKSATGFPGVKSHALRHAYASLLLSEGVKAQEIQALLGHSSIVTTQRYAELLNPGAPVAKANEMLSSL